MLSCSLHNSIIYFSTRKQGKQRNATVCLLIVRNVLNNGVDSCWRHFGTKEIFRLDLFNCICNARLQRMVWSWNGWLALVLESYFNFTFVYKRQEFEECKAKQVALWQSSKINPVSTVAEHVYMLFACLAFGRISFKFRFSQLSFSRFMTIFLCGNANGLTNRKQISDIPLLFCFMQ